MSRYFLLCFLSVGLTFSALIAKEDKPPKIGNFALPASQQPATLFGFGGNIIDKGEVQFFFFADDLVGSKKRSIDLIPCILLGITDKLSIFYTFPYVYMREGPARSRDAGDFFVQLEYAFYNKSTSTYVDQATILGNVTIPTGSSIKNPNRGLGAPSFFIAGTYNRTWADWFVFGAPGVILTTADFRTRFGNQFLYQFGFGRNIPSPKGWIYAWMVDIDGQFSEKNRIDGSVDNSSGGNLVFVTPSLWFSSKDLIIQFGASFPIQQNVHGKQRKFNYALNLNLAWSIY